MVGDLGKHLDGVPEAHRIREARVQEDAAPAVVQQLALLEHPVALGTRREVVEAPVGEGRGVGRQHLRHRRDGAVFQLHRGVRVLCDVLLVREGLAVRELHGPVGAEDAALGVALRAVGDRVDAGVDEQVVDEARLVEGVADLVLRPVVRVVDVEGPHEARNHFVEALGHARAVELGQALEQEVVAVLVVGVLLVVGPLDGAVEAVAVEGPEAPLHEGLRLDVAVLPERRELLEVEGIQVVREEARVHHPAEVVGQVLVVDRLHGPALRRERRRGIIGLDVLVVDPGAVETRRGSARRRRTSPRRRAGSRSP